MERGERSEKERRQKDERGGERERKQRDERERKMKYISTP